MNPDTPLSAMAQKSVCGRLWFGVCCRIWLACFVPLFNMVAELTGDPNTGDPAAQGKQANKVRVPWFQLVMCLIYCNKAVATAEPTYLQFLHGFCMDEIFTRTDDQKQQHESCTDEFLAGTSFAYKQMSFEQVSSFGDGRNNTGLNLDVAHNSLTCGFTDKQNAHADICSRDWRMDKEETDMRMPGIRGRFMDYVNAAMLIGVFSDLQTGSLIPWLILEFAVFGGWCFKRLSRGRNNNKVLARICKRRHARSRCKQYRQSKSMVLVVLYLLPTTVSAMDEQQFERFVQAMSSTGRGLDTVSKVLKAPEAYSGDTSWVTWRHSFLNWMGYGETEIVNSIATVERMAVEESVEMDQFTDAIKTQSQRLYSILTSYLRGSALQVSRSLAADRNGFKLWKTLMNQHAPNTKQRALALSQAISSFPAFTRERSFAESIAQLEQLVNEYEMAVNKEYDREILSGVLLRCTPTNIRQHLTLSMGPGTTYSGLKESLLLY